ncbi:MAG: iron-sulfur cluster assembly scaffold protein [Anaerolineae bacterium]|nr:iron-sulfur cluster assembly scaffold protein [Anaerolineae bacterium]
MPLPYSEIVMEHFKRPRNVGRLEDADAKATEGSPACGDMVTVYLKVDEQTHRITDIRFESYGCASNIATGSIITELAKGKTIEEAKQLTWKDAAEALGGLPPVKVHCSVLAIDGLRAAIQNYEEKKGLIKERVPTTLEEINRRLKRVMNPVVGLDIVRTKIVRDVTLENGVVRVTIDMPADHQFANNIREEIMEKLGTLWDIQQVEVEFVG